MYIIISSSINIIIISSSIISIGIIILLHILVFFNLSYGL